MAENGSLASARDNPRLTVELRQMAHVPRGAKPGKLRRKAGAAGERERGHKRTPRSLRRVRPQPFAMLPHLNAARQIGGECVDAGLGAAQGPARVVQ